MDIGRALEKIAYDDSTAGKTFELHGNRAYTMHDIREMIKIETKRNLINYDIPKQAQKIYRSILDLVWWRVPTPDEVEREFIDQVIDPTALKFADLGMDKVDDISEKILDYVRHYRSARYYELPPMTEKEKQEEKKYWHVQDDVYN